MELLEQEIDQVLEAAKQVAKAETGRLEVELRHRGKQGALLFMALTALGTAFFFAVLAGYNLLSSIIGPAGAAAVVAGIALLTALLLVFAASRPPSGSALLRKKLAEETAKSSRLELELKVRDLKSEAFGTLRRGLGIGRVAWEALMGIMERILDAVLRRNSEEDKAAKIEEVPEE